MPENDLALLTEAAFAAGEIAKGFFKQDPQIWDKPDQAGPVTEADLAVNETLVSKLQSARPDYGWLSEESDDGEERLSRDYTFIIDPIDGTRSFIDGNPTWSHSLAIAHRGQITAGVVYLPMHDKLFAASKGMGARLNDELIKVSKTPTLDGATVLAAKPNLDPKYWTKGTPPIDRHFRSSLAYRLSLVAQGRFDAMITFRKSWEWDIAAGSLIAAEAGATVTDQTGAPLSFNAPSPMLNGVIVASPAVHDGLTSALL